MRSLDRAGLDDHWVRVAEWFARNAGRSGTLRNRLCVRLWSWACGRALRG